VTRLERIRAAVGDVAIWGVDADEIAACICRTLDQLDEQRRRGGGR
jgi:hypothetical protein